MPLIDVVLKFTQNNYCAIILALFIVLLMYSLANELKLHLPPGPRGLPLVGYLPFLGPTPYKHFIELRKKYGNVIGLQLGARYTVVLTDLTAIKEAYSKTEFLARPKGLFKFNNLYDNFVNMRGKIWTEHMRFNKGLLRDLGMGKEKIELIIHEQLSRIINKIELLRDSGSKEINLQEVLALSSDNVIFYMICGKTYPDGDERLKVLHQFQIHSLRYFSSTSLAVYFPFLKPLILRFNPYYKNTKQAITNMENLLRSEIESHEKNLDPDNPLDFMDHFLLEIERKQGQNGFTKNVLNGAAQFLMLGGSETSRVSLEWALMLMAKHQDVQEKVYSEILQVLGAEKNVSWRDKESLPYTYATLLEIQRRKTIAPLSVIRSTQARAKLWEYDIPKDTVVIANLWSVHMDPDKWPEPKKFDPNRFLSPDGKSVRLNENLIPFSYGKRMCPAEKMGLMQLFISFVTLMQRFKFTPPKNGLDFSKIATITYVPINSKVNVELR